MYTGDYNKGHNLLSALERKFSDHNNHFIKKQIYTILGHLAFRKGSPENALSYMQQAYESAIKDKGNLYKLIAQYNVARAMQFVKQTMTAKERFKEVIVYAEQLNEQIFRNLAHLRLAQIYSEEKSLETAKLFVSEINSHDLLPTDITTYQKLCDRLKSCS
ncbi:MAG: hypothetical protein HWE10_14930 [Gammaproteobacteria bacterium]|nr:hypothetical protein [Gammaproteobacteria bacterium]